MPANPKYLSSRFQRFLKTFTAILGGYMVSSMLHIAIASWTNKVPVIATGVFTTYILWVVLMIVAFLAKNGWKVLFIYTTLSTFFYLVYFLDASV